MPTIKLILQAPYKTAPVKDKPEHDQPGQSAVNGTKKGKGKKRPLNPKETRLYCFLILDREKIIKIKTEHVIFPKEWDFDKQLKNEKLAGSPEFNDDLNKLKKDIWDKYKETKKKYPDMPFNQVARILKDYGKTKEIPFSDDDKDVFGYLKEYREFLKIDNSPGTIAKFVSIENSLKEFIKTDPGKKYESLTFSMIDHSFKSAYTNFLHNQPARGRMKTRPEGTQTGVLLATESKYIADIKTFCKWAEERKYNKYSTYKEFSAVTKAGRKRKTKKHDIVTLTLPELIQFYGYKFADNKDLTPEKQQLYGRVRDLWCFGAFTVQRWSDIDRFNKNQLKGDVWKFEAYKTKQETEIYLTGYSASAKDILEKYNYQLPRISLAKFNLYLKEAAKFAGITVETKKIRYVGAKEIPIIKPKYKFLSSHDARRSGVSILLNDYNMNPVHVMRITNHTDLKTLQAYINPDSKSRRDAMDKTKRITELLTVVKKEAV
jgi:integrase